MAENVLVAHWEGPFEWEKNPKHGQEEHVLYALFGAHPLYGRDVLLYFGKAEKGVVQRLPDHHPWVEHEYDRVSVRLASLGAFKSWDDWNSKDRYPRAPIDMVRAAESLLIISHQPAYNSRGKQHTTLARNVRLFNTGRLGHLLPEVSSAYHLGEGIKVVHAGWVGRRRK